MRLDEYLNDHNISPAAFAETIGVRRMQVWRYLNAGVVPRPQVIQRIFEASEGAVTANDLLGLHSGCLPAVASPMEASDAA